MWRMRDGAEIAIRDMDDRHLANCARMLLRTADRLHLARALEMAAAAVFCNGDMARDAIESEIAAFQNMPPEEFVRREWAPIFNECQRRKMAITKEKTDA